MALPNESGLSVVVVGPGFDERSRAVLQLTSPWPRHRPTTALRSLPMLKPVDVEPPAIVLRLPAPALDRAPTIIRIEDVLRAWRAAERSAAGIAEGSPEWPYVQANIQRLRAWYHRLHDERRRG